MMIMIVKMLCVVLFLIAGFCIIWAMGGYSFSLKIIGKLKKIKPIESTDRKPTVTVMVVAHNEESVIAEKLKNLIMNDYPRNKIKYLIASDNSTDNTNQIVMDFIAAHRDLDITLYTSKEHKGKTNAQNEAQKMVDSEILVMTDANSMFEKNAISELISSFSNEDISYVCGALLYLNTDNVTAGSESNYWSKELQTRLIESNIKTITAGNGAIYACRNKDYIEINPIECHDSSMPYYYGMHGKRAIFNEKAIAYEKAGETTEDEYKRKVRMNRVILTHLKNGLKAINIFRYGWFSYFYFGHRTARYMLWLCHFIVLASNVVLAITGDWFWKILLICQCLFYISGIIGKYTDNKVFHMIYYYCVTVLAQWHGVFNIITGKAKPTWEKAESTR